MINFGKEKIPQIIFNLLPTQFRLILILYHLKNQVLFTTKYKWRFSEGRCGYKLEK